MSKNVTTGTLLKKSRLQNAGRKLKCAYETMDVRCWKLAFFVFLMYYVLLFVGAAIIMIIEANELENTSGNKMNATKSLEMLLQEELNVAVNKSGLSKIMLLAQDIAAKKRKNDNMQWKRKISWSTFYKWRYFTHTTLTTVGFGDIVPDTDGGKIFVMIYSTIGIPLNILVTTCIGFLLSQHLNRLVRRIDKCIYCTAEAHNVEFKTLLLLVVMCVVWLTIGAGMTSKVMKWSWLEGYYTVFVKFSTIGYGDFTLDFSKVSQFWEVLSWYTNIGLAMVAGIFDSLTKVVEKRNASKIDQCIASTGKEEVQEFAEQEITVKARKNTVSVEKHSKDIC